jgi:lipopolysaccharide/colanic/teichoic acid biosynthesis glycosyltransferase
MKRLIDILFSIIGLVISSPVIIPVTFLIWFYDKKNPFYIAQRVGKNEKVFNMVKLRSMAIGSDKNGVDSTSADDNRITPIGKLVRSYKLDEISQLWNVLLGDMSLVGPRPNVKTETDIYTSIEKKILLAKPGITDLASIVFSDEGSILKGESDPNIAYNQLIRPWKSRLALVYIENSSITLDIGIIFYTVISFLSKPMATRWVSMQLEKIGADKKLINVTLRLDDLEPFPPPGSNKVVTSR